MSLFWDQVYQVTMQGWRDASNSFPRSDASSYSLLTFQLVLNAKRLTQKAVY